MSVNIYVTKSQHLYSAFFDFFCSDLILFLIFRRVMSATIQFYSQFRTGTIEIDYIITNGFLPLKSDRIGF